MTDAERQELIQLVAVGVFMLEEDEFGDVDAMAGAPDTDVSTDMRRPSWVFLNLIMPERIRQDEKFGAGRTHKGAESAMILVEEIGEWANEILSRPWSDSGWQAVMLRLEGAGDMARQWIENHDGWVGSQKAVIDAEKSSKDS